MVSKLQVTLSKPHMCEWCRQTHSYPKLLDFSSKETILICRYEFAQIALFLSKEFVVKRCTDISGTPCIYYLRSYFIKRHVRSVYRLVEASATFYKEIFLPMPCNAFAACNGKLTLLAINSCIIVGKSTVQQVYSRTTLVGYIVVKV